jgi:serine/threonine-protein kinase
VCGQSPSAGNKVAKGTKVVYDISTGPDTVQIPNVYGMTKDNAVNTLTSAGFKVSFADEVYSSSVAVGCVVSQNKSGAANRDDTVTLTLSKGPEPTPTQTVKVPNIVGMDVNAASNALTSVGLTLNYTGNVTGMTVETQNPAAGTTVEKGTSVTATFA